MYKIKSHRHLSSKVIHIFIYASGVASIWVNSSTGENKIIIVPGANNDLVQADMENAKPLIKSSKYLAVTLESDFGGILAALKIAKENNVTTVMNAAPARRDLKQGDLWLI